LQWTKTGREERKKQRGKETKRPKLTNSITAEKEVRQELLCRTEGVTLAKVCRDGRAWGGESRESSFPSKMELVQSEGAGREGEA
jgi:hypothetical protein